tara:strand:- start:12219 stop:13154 length:936 start_codon:yes stop_codon:yes gene_type:complete
MINDIESDVSTIDVFQGFKIIWKNKLLILLITFIASVGSVIYALSLPNYYTSSALLSQKDGSSSEGLLSQYSGIASMAGISLPSGGGVENKTDIAIAILQSRYFLEQISEDIENFRPIIIASKAYDQVNDSIIFDTKIYDKKNNLWVRKVRPPTPKEPSLLELHKVFNKEVFSFDVDKKTGFISLYVELVSPRHAEEFLTIIISNLNEISRKQALLEADQSLGFLEEEFLQASQVTLKNSISKLSDIELKKKMMAKINKDFLLKVIDPPFVPEFKSKPSRAIICILGFMLGIITSLVLIFIKELFVKKQSK